jgi:hypothetical protein
MEPFTRLLLNVTNNTLLTPLSAPPSPPKPKVSPGRVHFYMMVIVWLGLGTIGLWSMLFKQSKWTNYIHTIVMSILIIMNWMSGFLAIIYYGVTPRIGIAHIILGFGIICGITIQGALGIVTWACQKSAKIGPYWVYVINLSHRILGYVMYVLAMIECLIFLNRDSKRQPWFLATLIISMCSYSGFLFFKFFKRDMQRYAAIPDRDDKNIPLIRNLR